eukprot:552779-Prorocentrum_minimum.AAC.3
MSALRAMPGNTKPNAYVYASAFHWTLISTKRATSASGRWFVPRHATARSTGGDSASTTNPCAILPKRPGYPGVPGVPRHGLAAQHTGVSTSAPATPSEKFRHPSAPKPTLWMQSMAALMVTHRGTCNRTSFNTTSAAHSLLLAPCSAAWPSGSPSDRCSVVGALGSSSSALTQVDAELVDSELCRLRWMLAPQAFARYIPDVSTPAAQVARMALLIRAHCRSDGDANDNPATAAQVRLLAGVPHGVVGMTAAPQLVPKVSEGLHEGGGGTVPVDDEGGGGAREAHEQQGEHGHVHLDRHEAARVHQQVEEERLVEPLEEVVAGAQGALDHVPEYFGPLAVCSRLVEHVLPPDGAQSERLYGKQFERAVLSARQPRRLPTHEAT